MGLLSGFFGGSKKKLTDQGKYGKASANKVSSNSKSVHYDSSKHCNYVKTISKKPLYYYSVQTCKKNKIDHTPLSAIDDSIAKMVAAELENQFGYAGSLDAALVAMRKKSGGVKLSYNNRFYKILTRGATHWINK